MIMTSLVYLLPLYYLSFDLRLLIASSSFSYTCRLCHTTVLNQDYIIITTNHSRIEEYLKTNDWLYQIAWLSASNHKIGIVKSRVVFTKSPVCTYRYVISISQITNILFTYNVFFPLSLPRLWQNWTVYMCNMGESYKKLVS